MKIRSVGIFEDELKALLSNPHTSLNMRNAVSMAKQILELKTNNAEICNSGSPEFRNYRIFEFCNA